jgi:hypothetical protein
MIFIIIRSININYTIIWGINIIIFIIIELIIFRTQIIICLILILSTIIKIIIFIREIIIFRNLRPNSFRSWQRTQENWILMQDPLALGIGQASSSTTWAHGSDLAHRQGSPNIRCPHPRACSPTKT